MNDSKVDRKVAEMKKIKDAEIETLTYKYDTVVTELHILRKHMQQALDKKVASFNKESTREILNIRVET